MKTPNQKKSGDLVLALQRLHSLIGIAFPMETTRLTPGKVETLPASHEGSRLFISTRLFGNIQEQVPKIQAQLETLGADSWENNVRRL